MPPKCCSGTKRDIRDARFARRVQWQMKLKNMSEEEQEKQVRQWEEKYEVV